jgi:hypothetical protein
VIIGNVTAGKETINPGLLILKELKIFGSSGASRSAHLSLSARRVVTCS